MSFFNVPLIILDACYLKTVALNVELYANKGA
jgi:hypothetical protein